MADHTAPPTCPQPPLLAAVARARREVVAAAEGFDPDFLPTADKASLVRELHRLNAAVAALTMRTLAGAGDVAEVHGARDPGTWAAVATRSEFRAGRGLYRLGVRLRRWPTVQAAFGRGEVSVDHARAVLAALGALPADLDDDVLERAAKHLVTLCADHTPREVRLLGRKILEVIAPDAADAHLAALLEAEERKAREECRVDLHQRADGRWRLTGTLPAVPGLTLSKALDAIASPRRNDPDRGGSQDGYDDLDAGQKRGRALCELIEHLPVDAFPTAGRTPVQTVVTLPLDQLLADHGWATLDDHTLVTAGEARRAACRAGVIPAVLDGASAPLDLGRTHRYASPHQVLALRLTHATCQTRGCTVPAAWCDAHHRVPWSRGGRTDLADLALLCGHHHHRVHDPTYQTTWHPDGAVTLHRLHRRT